MKYLKERYAKTCHYYANFLDQLNDVITKTASRKSVQWRVLSSVGRENLYACHMLRLAKFYLWPNISPISADFTVRPASFSKWRKPATRFYMVFMRDRLRRLKLNPIRPRPVILNVYLKS